MFATERPDVVSVGVWHGGHAPWTIAAAAAKPKAILCEKPMAENLQRAEQMLIACRRNDVKLAIGHQRRFLPRYTMARNLIGEGAIGDVLMMTSYAAAGLPNYCSHQTDMFRYFLGDDGCEWVMGNVERKTDRWERSTRIEERLSPLLGSSAVPRRSSCPMSRRSSIRALIYTALRGMIDLDTRELKLMNASAGGSWDFRRPDGKFFELDDQGRRFEWVEGGAGADPDRLYCRGEGTAIGCRDPYAADRAPGRHRRRNRVPGLRSSALADR